MGHTYYFRARAWADYGGTQLYGVFAPEGDTHTTVGHLVSGYVRGNADFAVPGATVTISGTAASTITDSRGYYSLATPNLDPQWLTVSAPGYASPPPVPFMAQCGTVPITLTLRRTADPVVNGDFEEVLDGWTAMDVGSAQTAVVRSGGRSLALRDASSPGSSLLRQALSVASMYRPLLSFYAFMPAANPGDRLIAGLYKEADCVALPVQPAEVAVGSGWAHYYALLDGSEDFDGLLDICFRAEQAGSAPMRVYLDEISVLKIYAPLLLKSW
jgi:hypothetical protein